MSVITSSWPVHGARKAVVRVEKDEEFGGFQSGPDGLEGGIVESLGEASCTEDDTAYMG